MHTFWQETGLMNNNQFGFLKGGSTVQSMNDWAKSCDFSRPTEVVFLDLAKLCESVAHERLPL